MAVVISQIVTEIAVAPSPERAPTGDGETMREAQMEVIVRRAAERVIETLRREWDR